MKRVNARDLDSNTTLTTDICIIGGGAAGFALAESFIGRREKVLLVESGGKSFDEETQSLYDFENAGHPLRAMQGYVSRNRYLGGSTNTWHGGCAPLCPIDFRERKWVANSGWPINYGDLEEFYRLAAKKLRLPDFDLYTSDYWRKCMVEYEPGFLDGQSLSPVHLLFANRPANMRVLYEDALDSTQNVQILVNANVTEIEPNSSLGEVRRLHVSVLGGRQFFIEAKEFVLCCGGWENIRLLLVSNRHSSVGLGNEFDNVGRYYQEHPKITAGKLFPQNKMLLSPILIWKRRVSRSGFLKVSLRLSDAMQEKYRLPNHYIQLRYPKSMTDALASSDRFLEELGFSRSSIHSMVRMSPHIFKLIEAFERTIFNRPLKFEYLALFSHFEQEPNPESRVMLSNKKDSFGKQLPKVNLLIPESDKDSMIRYHNVVNEVLEKQGFGTFQNEFPSPTEEWPGLSDSSHHIGGTRMSVSPKDGVVDQNCRVHGISNLYIASSSVFPTGGHVNPTLTIVAIALRLAAHLKSKGVAA